jgi:hypothetical protein
MNRGITSCEKPLSKNRYFDKLRVSQFAQICIAFLFSLSLNPVRHEVYRPDAGLLREQASMIGVAIKDIDQLLHNFTEIFSM